MTANNDANPSTPSPIRSGTVQDRQLAYGWVAREVERALSAGHRPDRRALLARFPELADEIDDLVAALQEFHNLKPAASTDASSAASGQGSGTLGDFRIIRQIGEGGMGVVYEAEQISLGRRVALKVLPFAAMLDPRRLQRFKNEAMAAASLHHPQIVPVFAVGAERRVHYYAMQLIEGCTLADVIADFRRDMAQPGNLSRIVTSYDLPLTESYPQAVDGETTTVETDSPSEGVSAEDAGLPSVDPNLGSAKKTAGSEVNSSRASMLIDSRSNMHRWARRVASIGVQVADALQYAHERGVIHRDIKPSNLLLDEHENIWVTDFGLAQIEADAGLTLTGDVVGTLRYMSPEQAAGGESVQDQRTDVYSLGVTLYEMLTLHPAFPGADRAKLLRDVSTIDPVPPRKHNAAIPHDLETIITKATFKEPSERYGSARDFATDLQHFLDDEPIVAKRPTIVAHVTKWMRRRRLLVAVVLAALLVSTLVLATTTVLVLRAQSRTAKARDQAQELAFDADRHRQLAEIAARKATSAMLRERRQTALTQSLLYVSDMRLAWQAQQDGDIRQLNDLLQRHTVEDSEVDKRGFEWYWLKRFGTFESRQIAQLKTANYCIRYSPDGRLFAFAGLDGTIRVYDTSNLSPRRIISTNQSEVNGLTFDSVGQRLASAGDDGTVCIWSLESGELLHRFTVSNDLVFGVAFTPDDQVLATCGQEHVIRLWNPTTCEQIGELGGDEDGHLRTVEAIAISQNGKQLASVSADHTAKIWDLETRRCQYTLPCGTKGTSCVAFSPSGRWLATGNLDGVALIWDLAAKKSVLVAKHFDGIQSLAFDKTEDYLAIADRGGVIRWWHWFGDTGKHDRGVLTESTNWYSYGPARVQVITGKSVREKLTGEDRGQAPSDDNETDHIVLPRPAELVSGWQAHSDRIYGMDIAPDGQHLISAARDGEVTMWGRPTATVDGGRIAWTKDAVQDFSFIPTRNQLAVASGPNIEVISTEDWKVATKFSGGRAKINTICVARDGSLLATGTIDGHLQTWEMNGINYEQQLSHVCCDGAHLERATFAWNNQWIAMVPWKNENNIISSQGLHVLCLADGEPAVPEGFDASRRFACSPLDGRIAADNLNDILVYDEMLPENRLTLKGHTLSIQDLAFSWDGKMLVSVSDDRSIRLWDLTTGKVKWVMRGHEAGIRSVAFAPDDRTLVSGGNAGDRTVRLWNVATGQPLFVLSRADAEILKIVFSANAQYLAYLLGNGQLRVLDVSQN